MAANTQEKLNEKVNGDFTEKECLEMALKLSLEEQNKENKKGDLDQYTY